MALPQLVIEQWIYETLANDPTLQGLIAGRVYARLAPESAIFPYVTFNAQSQNDVNGVGAVRIMASDLYQVKVVSEGNDAAAIEPIATRIDELLHKAGPALNSRGAVFSSNREQGFDYLEPGQNGRFYYHLGGVYRIQAR